MRIAVTRKIPDEGLELIRSQAELALWEDDMPPEPEELRALAAGADGLLTLLTDRVDAALLHDLPSVRVVSNYAVGFDNIDVPACTAAGVAVCTTPDVLTETTADFAFALLLASARRVADAAQAVRDGEWRTWEPMGFLGPDVHGATLGIIGMGRIGQAVARRASGFAMRVIYYDAVSTAGDAGVGAVPVELDRLLAESDFISLHVPLTSETRGMIGIDQLRRMKSSAVLINTSRGAVVDLDDLGLAIDSGELWGAALDVTDPEPLPAAHPILRRPRVLVTPHIASASQATRGRMAELAAKNVLSVLQGEEPPRCLNPEVLHLGQDRSNG